MSDDDLDDLMNGLGDDDLSDDWTAALNEQQNAKGAFMDDDDMPSFDAPHPTDGEGRRDDVNLDVILDVPVTIALEIGRAKINIRNLLQLTQGSVVELDRLAGEPMDVLVNGTLIAHGEVVVVNDKFGIRLTDVLSPAERVQKLK